MYIDFEGTSLELCRALHWLWGKPVQPIHVHTRLETSAISVPFTRIELTVLGVDAALGVTGGLDGIPDTVVESAYLLHGAQSRMRMTRRVVGAACGL
jgi:hypothetical protein